MGAKKKSTHPLNMDSDDNGFFEYNFQYLPLCVKPSEHQMLLQKEIMQSALINYLRDSHQNGMKHENAILPSGMSAGEAGVQYFRQRGKACLSKNEQTGYDLAQLVESRIMNDLEIQSLPCLDIFSKCITPGLFVNPHFSKKLVRSLRNYFKEIHIAQPMQQQIIEHVLSDLNISNE